MHWRFLLLLVFTWFAGLAQDKIYLTDGSLINGRVLEVGIDEITYQENNTTQVVPKAEVVLIQYKNGLTETYTAPEKEVVAGKIENSRRAEAAPDNTQNLLSFNMLGLMNADLMFFYERLFFGKKMGAGALAGYNFNPHVNASFNTFMAPLTNAKKQGDLGLFLNFYRKPPGEGRTSFFGIAIKYTPIKFTSVHENSVTTGTLVTTNLVFKPGEGKQVSLLFHFGKHMQITKQFFVKAMAGVGFFKLTGEYKTQYNYMFNKNTQQLPAVEYSVLPKIFLALHAGYNF